MTNARRSRRLSVSQCARTATPIGVTDRVSVRDSSAQAYVGALLRQSGRVTLRTARTLAADVADVGHRLTSCLRSGGRAYVAGNGGSAADAQHFAAEFTGRFRHEREPLSVVSLSSDSSVLTCIANDYGFTEVFARQLATLGRPGDLFFALSTSGHSGNIIAACHAAHGRDMTVVSLTGRGGGALAELSDVAIRIPSGETARVQETTMTVLHGICDVVEQALGVVNGNAVETAGVELEPASLAGCREIWRQEGLAVVTTSGSFDVIDAPQISELWAAADLGDLLVVLLHSDELIRRRGRAVPPTNNQRDRVSVLCSLLPVDHVVLLHPDMPFDVLDLLAPSVHYPGSL